MATTHMVHMGNRLVEQQLLFLELEHSLVEFGLEHRMLGILLGKFLEVELGLVLRHIDGRIREGER